MFIGFIAILAAQSLSTDCGYAKHIQEIHFTESFIVKRVPLDTDELIGELPTKEGHSECVRLTFNVDVSGHAKDISVEDSSGEIMMNIVARRALEVYQFSTAAHHERQMLVFRAILGKAPPYPDGSQ